MHIIGGGGPMASNTETKRKPAVLCMCRVGHLSTLPPDDVPFPIERVNVTAVLDRRVFALW